MLHFMVGEGYPDSDAIEPAQFRSVLGRYPTGVCLITGQSSLGEPLAMVVGSFTSVSLNPPLVAFFLGAGSSTWPKMRTSGAFCVHILGADQTDLCRHIANTPVNKFDELRYTISDMGNPVLDDAVARIECRLENEFEIGDHSIAIGRVIKMTVERDIEPLLFVRGEYRGAGEAIS